ncbi:MAG TPA: carboxypeptidase-like regulatory domain-containing protein [Gemmataceae bacterium]|nr:carboxypeptidase-like regulatory domain-containing protein [Gemmataceae bacterium]
MRLSVRLSCLALLVVAPLACAPAGPTPVPVSGRITSNNRPLADADVVFIPAEGGEPGKPLLTSSGKTDGQGRYSLKLDDSRHDGAAPGDYKVQISIFDRGGEGRPPRGQLIPAAYNRNTTLRITVPPSGTTQADFNLPARP